MGGNFRLEAAIYDRVEYMFEELGFNDHQIHAVIRFAGPVDAGVMERAFMLVLSSMPLWSCRYHHDQGADHWEEASFEPDEVFRVVDTYQKFQQHAVSKTDAAAGPQITGCLFAGDTTEQPALSVTINHSVADAASFKECLYFLASYYTHLLSDPGYVPEPVSMGGRGIKDVVAAATFRQKAGLLFSGRKPALRDPGMALPMSHGADVAPFILTQSIRPERYARIVSYGRERDATLNDVVLAAYHRALSETLGVSEPVDVVTTVDMRRYLTREPAVLDNLSSLSKTTVAVAESDTFDDTLSEVRRQMNHLKSHLIGMTGFVQLWALFGLLPPRRSYAALKAGLANAHLCMTNLGNIKHDQLVFRDTPVAGAFITGPIQYRPTVQIGMSTYKDSITFSICLYGDDEDLRNAQRLCDVLDQELPGYDETSRFVTETFIAQAPA